MKRPFHVVPPRAANVASAPSVTIVTNVGIESERYPRSAYRCKRRRKLTQELLSAFWGNSQVGPERGRQGERKVFLDAVLPSCRRRSPETPHPLRAAGGRAPQRGAHGGGRVLGRVRPALPPPSADGDREGRGRRRGAGGGGGDRQPAAAAPPPPHPRPAPGRRPRHRPAAAAGHRR